MSHAAEKDNEAVVALLLENGALPDLEDADGETALSRALLRGNTKVIQLLTRAYVVPALYRVINADLLSAELQETLPNLFSMSRYGL